MPLPNATSSHTRLLVRAGHYLVSSVSTGKAMPIKTGVMLTGINSANMH
ncbi:hypothetical protein [Nitrosomonas communis]|nr:hypothetical protein [Nitrosomonas communis]